jgi:NTE family protein
MRMPSSSTATFLRQVPVLSNLNEDLLRRIASQVDEVTVRAGEWLVREGDLAESLYLIRSGRLEVVVEGPPETLIRVLRRGEVLGELALLTDEVRSASIRARRDSELLKLGRKQFEGLIQDAPGFALGLTRAMGAQLAASRTPATAPNPPRTIAALPLDEGAPVAEAAQLLATALRQHGSVAKLAPDAGRRSSAEMTSLLERAESENDRVVLVGEAAAPGEEWTDFCVREADAVFALSLGAPSRDWLDRPDALLGCELVVLAPAVSEQVLATLRPREVQVVPEGSDLQPSVDLTARRMAGRAIGIVLSGGGARAFAHLGVMAELQAAGVVIDRIGGVSLGSLVGAAFAAGHTSEELAEPLRKAFVDVNPTGDYTLPLFSLIRGGRTRGLLRGFFGDRRIEELRTRYFSLSCDLIKRESVVHRTGPLHDAILASLSIPGVLPPISTPDGRLLVDGGVLDNLPVGVMAQPGEGPVIAVDVTSRMGDFRKPVRPGIARLGKPIRRYLTGSEAELPRFGETVLRTVTVGSTDTVEAARRHADLVIQPSLEGVGLLDWRQLERVTEAGRVAARQALERAPAWLTGSSPSEVADLGRARRAAAAEAAAAPGVIR